jgi:hypothetical protein
MDRRAFLSKAALALGAAFVPWRAVRAATSSSAATLVDRTGPPVVGLNPARAVRDLLRDGGALPDAWIDETSFDRSAEFFRARGVLVSSGILTRPPKPEGEWIVDEDGWPTPPHEDTVMGRIEEVLRAAGDGWLYGEDGRIGLGVGPVPDRFARPGRFHAMDDPLDQEA